jgi:predicted MFS family arabinose efflux permease
MQVSKRIIDWVNLLIGIWLIISPWVLGTVASTTSTVVLVIMGIALVVFSAWALFQLENRAAELWHVFLGVLLFVLPWIFSYTGTHGEAWNSWIFGVVVAILSLITMPMINGMHRREQQHHA